MNLFQRLKENSKRIAEQERLKDAVRGTGGTLSVDQVALLSPEQQRALRGTAYDAGMRGIPSKTLAANYQAQQLNQVSQNLMAQINNSQLPEATKQGLRGMAMLGQFDKVVSALNPTPKEKRIVKGADGFQYYSDTGKRVLPNVAQTPDTKDSFGNQDKLRDDFRADSKEFKGVRDSYGRILAVGSKDATPAGDLSLIFNYMKMLDPGSVVRESEFANAAASGSFGERVKAAYGKVESGERLSEVMRQDFVQQAAALYEAQLESHQSTKSEYSNLATQYGFKPENVVFDYTSSLAPKIFKSNIRYMSDIDLANLDFDALTEEQQKVVKKELEKRN